MVSTWRKIILFLLVVLLVGCGSKEAEKSSKPKHPERQKARDFTLPDLKGTERTLSSLRGKVVILDFWATWCAPCRVEIPHLVSLYNKYKGDGLIVWGVGLDRKSSLESFAKQYAINYPIPIGTQELAGEWGIRSIPTTYILDGDLRIAFKHVGFMPGMQNQLEDEVKSLLKEKY